MSGRFDEMAKTLATPMPRGQFLLSILTARLAFMIPEILLVLLVGWLGFRVPMMGNLLTWIVVVTPLMPWADSVLLTKVVTSLFPLLSRTAVRQPSRAALVN